MAVVFQQVLACNRHTAAFFSQVEAFGIIKDTTGSLRAAIIKHVMNGVAARHQASELLLDSRQSQALQRHHSNVHTWLPDQSLILV